MYHCVLLVVMSVCMAESRAERLMGVASLQKVWD